MKRPRKEGQESVPCEIAAHATVNGATIPRSEETAMTKTTGAVERGHLRGTTKASASPSSSKPLLSNRTSRFHGAPVARD